MSDSAPREAAQPDPEQAGAAHAKAEQAADGETARQDPGQPAGTEDAEDAEDAADGKPDMDEVKRKFREALDKKHEAQAQDSATSARNTGKIHGAHGSEDHRRSFRRKSG